MTDYTATGNINVNDLTRDELRALLKGELGDGDRENIDRALRWVCTSCGKPGGVERYDRYAIYAGKLCDPCWSVSGARTWVFDAAYAGESLEEEDY